MAVHKRHFYLGLIPARGGSKRIPNKNLARLGGKPLIAYTVEAALATPRLSRVVVSTDSPRIAAYARTLGAEAPFLRPAFIAGDRSPVLAAVRHAVSWVEREGTQVDAVVLLQPTSPFRSKEHIAASIARYETTSADTLTAVCPTRRHPYYAWTTDGRGMLRPFFSLRHQSMPSQHLPAAFAENGAIYIVRRSQIDAGSLYGHRIVPFIMDCRFSLDIDTPADLAQARKLMRKRCR
jgi:CMP-N-acetylneuraminic acid synthetase